MIPQVVIVGRPNVGKSSLFNWIVEKRIAIEDPTAGVTRDRLVQRVELDGRVIELVDTGGMGFDDPDGLTAQIDRQIESGLAGAAVVLFVVDVRSGLLPADQEVARRVRRTGCPVLLIVNKADAPHLDPQAHEFAALGFGPPLVVSAREHRNRGPLIDAIVERLPPATDDEPESAELPEMKLAMVGRRNVGKSTFVNALAREERVITSPVAGTTRDSIDVRFEVDGRSFLAIDTPGLRRAKSRTSDIDFYSTHRAQRSIRRADVVLLFFDATEPIGKVDKQLAETITEEAKPATQAAPPMSPFMSSMPCAGLIEMPPVSKVTPLPMKASGASPALPPRHSRMARRASWAEPWATPSSAFMPSRFIWAGVRMVSLSPSLTSGFRRAAKATG
jgi:GTP-binding protein